MFLQLCVLGSRTTPPPAIFGYKGDTEDKYLKIEMGFPKPIGNLSSTKLPPAVQQKMNPKTEDVTDHKLFNCADEKSKYQLPVKVCASPSALNSHLPVLTPSDTWITGPIVSGTAEKMFNMNVRPIRQYNKNYRPPPLMKAGGWHVQSDAIHGGYQNLPPVRGYARKAAG